MSNRFHALSLGQGQAPIATRMIKEGVKDVSYCYVEHEMKIVSKAIKGCSWKTLLPRIGLHWASVRLTVYSYQQRMKYRRFKRHQT